MDWLEELQEMCLYMIHYTDAMMEAAKETEREYAQIVVCHDHRNNNFITTVDVLDRLSCEVYINDGHTKQHFEYVAGEIPGLFNKIISEKKVVKR
jgi:hypothetical protein